LIYSLNFSLKENKRIKSAYPRYPVPSDRIVLQIPSPELKSLFNDEKTDLDTTSTNSNNSNSKQIRPKTSVANRSTTNLSNYTDENSNDEKNIEHTAEKVQVSNVGKIPIIDNSTIIQETLCEKSTRRKKLIRPKTAVDQVVKAGMKQSSDSHQAIQTNEEHFNLLKRSKSCLTRKTNPTFNSKSTQTLNVADINNYSNTVGNSLKYSSTHNLNSNNLETASTNYINGVMIKKGNWKDDLLNRGYFILF
jgi:hypothetical protein